MSEFVNVYSKTTGKKQRIPQHWLDHPKLGRPFELTPSARAAEQNDDQPPSDQLPPLPVDETSSTEELLTYAAENEIDLGDAQTEAEALAVIRLHHESPSGGEEE